MSLPELMHKRRSKRRSFWSVLFTIIVLIVVVYTIVWFVLTNLVEGKVSEQLQLYGERGFDVLCENMHKTGYPLRIGVACDTVNFKQPLKGVAFSSEKLVAGAPVYMPHRLELSIGAPASVEVPGLVPIQAKWSNFIIETNIRHVIPDRISLTAENFIIGAKAEAEALINRTTGKFLRVDATASNGGLSVKLNFDQLTLPLLIPHENTPFPEISGDIQVALEDAATLFEADGEGNWVERLRGHNGTLKSAKINFSSGGEVTISGPFSFNDEGYLTAKFEIAIADQSDLLRTARNLFPSQVDNLKTIFFALNAMPKNSDGNPVLLLVVNQGEAQLGFFKLGRIEPI